MSAKKFVPPPAMLELLPPKLNISLKGPMGPWCVLLIAMSTKLLGLHGNTLSRPNADFIPNSIVHQKGPMGYSPWCVLLIAMSTKLLGLHGNTLLRPNGVYF